MNYWIYENWRAHGYRVTIHKETCSFVNSGRGIHQGATPGRNGQWHGPFRNYQEAMRTALEFNHRGNRPIVRECKFCK